MRGIELRQLRYFSILARELHFRRAADLACITQPALSQQISKLEATVGVALLLRDGRKVELTAAGARLQQEVDRMFDQLQRALRLTREAAEERQFRLAIGMVEFTNLPFVPPALTRLQAAYPGLTVQRHEMVSIQQMEALVKGEIDVGIGVQVGLLPGDGSIRALPVMRGPWVLVMRDDHRLAALAQLQVEDIVGERVIFFERALIPQLYDGVVNACRNAGFTPGFVYETRQAQVGVSMVAEGMGVMLGAAYIFAALPPGLTVRPFRDMDPLQVYLFSRSDEGDPLAHEFMELAAEEARRIQVRLDARY
ncbi:MAG: LysR substrate-binding domain-containing protein [Duganella sp.]